MFTLVLFAPNLVDQLLLRFFSEATVNYVIWPFIQIGAVVTAVAVYALYATYAERKISAFMQARLGPMRVGPYGLLQPIADAIKLLTKEDLMPDKADPYIFRFAPYASVVAAFLVLVVVPFAPAWGVITDLNIALLFLLGVSSFGVLSLILAGWASNSKYALLGGVRSSAQMVSYEVAMALSIIGALMFSRTLSLSGITTAQDDDNIWFFFYQPLAFFIFFISGVAENNRAPFDLPEAESEIVAGFHTEYSGMRWSLFFMAEYAAIAVIAAVATTLFLGGWWFPGVYWLTVGKLGSQMLYIFTSLAVFILKMTVLIYIYFWLRWTFPRYRYDQLMDLGWKWLIPASLVNIIWTGFAIFVVQAMHDWRGIKTIESMKRGLNLTATGKGIIIAFGFAGLFVALAVLSLINQRSRDFNLRKQRREIKLIQIPTSKPAEEAAESVTQ
jgi:NADH-quinone oxidoreductase subunit H